MKMTPAGEYTPACPRRGARCAKNGSADSKKGKGQTFSCKGAERRGFALNSGFERRRHPSGAITRTIRLYFETRGASPVADETKNAERGRGHPRRPGG